MVNYMKPKEHPEIDRAPEPRLDKKPLVEDESDTDAYGASKEKPEIEDSEEDYPEPVEDFGYQVSDEKRLPLTSRDSRITVNTGR